MVAARQEMSAKTILAPPKLVRFGASLTSSSDGGAPCAPGGLKKVA
jgi:hypothetical protein